MYFMTHLPYYSLHKCPRVITKKNVKMCTDYNNT